MPKASKSKTPRTTPLTVTVTPPVDAATPKVKKPRKSSFINSTNHKLPVMAVSPQELTNLQALTQRDVNRHPVQFNALFTRQNKFGGWEFQLTDGVYESLMEVITSDLEYDADANKCCITKDDYTGHWRLRAKPSKAYLAAHADTSVPVPKENTIVAVTGAIETGKIKGEHICYCQFDTLHQIVQHNNVNASEDEESE